MRWPVRRHADRVRFYKIRGSDDARFPTRRQSPTAAALIGSAIWANVAFSACVPPRRGPVPLLRQQRIIISAAGISRTGGPAQFEFFNDDSEAHQIVSDPHPGHDRCPELNLGIIAPRRSAYRQFHVRGRICGYHDEVASRRQQIWDRS